MRKGSLVWTSKLIRMMADLKSPEVNQGDDFLIDYSDQDVER